MSTDNPYAYFETQKSATQPTQQPVSDTGTSFSEPKTPFDLYLFHRTGLFSSVNCVMKVFQDHLELRGPHLAEPVRLDRTDAKKTLKFKMTRLYMKTPDKKKYVFSFQKSMDRELQLARLETWTEVSGFDDTDSSRLRVENNLKKRCGWYTWSDTVFLGTLQLIVTLAIIGISYIVIFNENAGNMDVRQQQFIAGRMAFIGGITSLFCVINYTVAILLAYRKTGAALLLAIVSYAFFLLLSLLGINPIGVLIAIAVLYHAYTGRSALERQILMLDKAEQS